ncbi:hypothetical protein [Janthinobacterium agaricidamnosum]|uniref:Uncharacterized protein n=1 Tax=Janthinobacterium agaricidamnosum NBRC 102515 = DSM 9628 TaxID=1349767 RepID=W0V5S3_9BURK|nr:hypothetical protein [Janthinobacterium agaricidamnosum]CDG83236.1 hypothetical protein GJA_2605 [Janthinobacterium agaricidamnosum NBRC 102515 = DSM 9628]
MYQLLLGAIEFLEFLQGEGGQYGAEPGGSLVAKGNITLLSGMDGVLLPGGVGLRCANPTYAIYAST